MKKLLTFPLVLCLVFHSFSASPLTSPNQEPEKLNLSSGMDLTSRYFWRGLALSPGISVQPFMQVAYGNFALGTWGSTTLHPFEFQEVDLYLSYEIKNIRFTLNDYLYFDDLDSNIHYFDFRKHHTSHVFELMAEFTGTDKIPFRILGAYNLYGNDPSNSVYFELAWMKSFKTIDMELFCGYTPDVGYYHGTKKGFTNIGISMKRVIEAGKSVNLPLKIAWIHNPLIRKSFLVVTLSIK